jgi:hypothetical protein
MEVLVGECWTNRNGCFIDERRPVVIDGRALAVITRCDDDGHRGVTQRLIEAAGGRLLVHVVDWSHYQGETSRYRLVEVSRDDLDLGGPFERLGRAAGLARPLSLDEALGLGREA